jgi:branched-chain amino acid transport system substrate-binding protein
MEGKKFGRAASAACASVLAIAVCVGVLFGQTAFAAAPKEILLGNVLPMSGPLKTGGESSTEGSQLAVSEINAAGGVLGRQVRLITRDDEVRPTTALKMIQELYEAQGVRLFLGGMSSGVALAEAPLIEKLNSVFIVTGAGSADITGSKLNPRVFRVAYDNATSNFALADLVHKEYPNAHKWAAINQDYAWGHSSLQFFSGQYKKVDPQFTVAVSRWTPMGSGSGYGPHISAIMDSGADALYSSFVGTTDVAGFIREAKAYGLFDKIKVFALSHTDFTDPPAVGKDMASYWSCSHYYAPAFTSARAKAFQSAMEQKLGKEQFFLTQGHAVNGYDAVYAYKAAIEKARTDDPAAVVKALEGISFDSPVGKKVIRAGDHQSYHNLPYIHFAADVKDPKGWRIDRYVVIDGAKYAGSVEERLKF